MCCNNGLTSRSDPSFFLFPSPPRPPSTLTTTIRTRISQPDPFPLLSSKTHNTSRIFIHTTRPVSFKPKAALNDASSSSVTSPPSLSEPMSFYELLGIPESGTLFDIKQAYKQLARKYHPDVSPPDRVKEYTLTFIRVQEAYETLSDPNMKALYDSDMAKGIHFAFSARRRFQNDEQMEEKSAWKSRWQTQLSELKRKSMNKNTRGNMSWAARMRMQSSESST